jgi:hypothetical protein
MERLEGLLEHIVGIVRIQSVPLGHGVNEIRKTAHQNFPGRRIARATTLDERGEIRLSMEHSTVQ